MHVFWESVYEHSRHTQRYLQIPKKDLVLEGWPILQTIYQLQSTCKPSLDIFLPLFPGFIFVPGEQWRKESRRPVYFYPLVIIPQWNVWLVFKIPCQEEYHVFLFFFDTNCGISFYTVKHANLSAWCWYLQIPSHENVNKLILGNSHSFCLLSKPPAVTLETGVAHGCSTQTSGLLCYSITLQTQTLFTL